MSRAISTALKNHLAGECTTLALLWQVIRRDGQTFGFTDHDQDITYNGVTFVASAGFSASAVSTSAALNVDNLDVTSMFSQDAVTESDLLAGVWDNAEVKVYLCNWQDLSQGVMKVRRGWIGQVKTGRGQFTSELRGLMQRLQQNIGEVYSPTCRADLGDARCKFNVTGQTFAGTVASVTSRRVFASGELMGSIDHWYDFGIATFISGANAGLSMEIKTNLSGSFELVLPMPHDIAIGDQVSFQVGCDRTRDTCRTKFNNVINFRGEPDLPGVDRIIQYGVNATT